MARTNRHDHDEVQQDDPGLPLDGDGLLPPDTPQEPVPSPENTKRQFLDRSAEIRPHCPRCSTAERPVLMVAYRTHIPFTYYRCKNYPKCRETSKRLRPELAKMAAAKRQKAGGRNLKDR